MFGQFCSGIGGPISSGVDKCITSTVQDIHFTFDYNSTSGCSVQCHDAFDGLKGNCTFSPSEEKELTNDMPGTYGPDSKYTFGFTELSCGTAMYTIEQCDS